MATLSWRGSHKRELVLIRDGILVLSQIAKFPVKRLGLEFFNVACLFKNTRFHSTPNVQGKSLSLIEAGIVRDNNGYKGLLVSIFRQCTARLYSSFTRATSSGRFISFPFTSLETAA